jgi:hypothetical protein
MGFAAFEGWWRCGGGPMDEALLHDESPTEYFRELVESAMQHQQVEVGSLTSFYVVNLLAGFAHGGAARADEEPLGVRLVRALQAGGSDQRDGLRRVGDTSLFVSGFFSDSLARGLVDLDYYINLGERAYGSLARQGDVTFRDVFDELSSKFPTMVDVLAEVSERSALTSNSDLLRLYERWLRTGSRRSGTLLASRGIVPCASPARFIQ